MHSSFLHHAVLARKRVAADTGFTEIADSEAGLYTTNSLASAIHWTGFTTLSTGFDTEDHRDSSLYNAISSGEVRVLSDGLYLVMASLVADRLGGSNRSTVRGFVRINDTAKPVGASIFIRRVSGHDSDETTMAGIFRLSANDDIELGAEKLHSGSDAYWTGSVNSNTTQNSSMTVLRLNKNNPFISLTNTGTANDQQLTADDTDTDMNWNSQTEIDTDFYTHSTSTNPDEITLKQAGKYLVCYTNYWERLTDDATRTGVYERLQLDGTTVPGTFSNNYIRGSQSGESILKSHNNAITLIETTSADQVVKLTAAREAGAITCERKSTESSIQIYLLHGNEEVFSVGSTSTENVGSTTGFVPTFDSTDFIDSNYSLSSNQITVTGNKSLLMGGAYHTDSSDSARVAPRLSMRANATESLLFAGAGYNRSDGTMQRTSPQVVGIVEPTDGQTVDLFNISTAVSGTSTNRVASSGRFWGLDINTL